MAVDAQKIVARYLRDHSEVAALSSRVVTKPPGDTDYSWVQVVEQNEGRDLQDPTHWLVECYFQCDCYAGLDGGLPEASGLARAVRDALIHISDADHEGGVITASAIENGFNLMRDPDLLDGRGDPRDRVIVTASVWCHP